MDSSLELLEKLTEKTGEEKKEANFIFKDSLLKKEKGKSHLTGEHFCSRMILSSLRDILVLFMFWQNL